MSVIIPYRNPGHHFQPLLESVLAQVVDEPTEVVLVNNGSTDGSSELARRVHGRLPTKHVNALERLNASYARNVGVRSAAGEKLLFVDADDRISQGYVQGLARALDRFDVVTSRVDCLSSNAEWLQCAQGPPWEGILTYFDFMPASGINIGIRRVLFDKVGGFPEEYSASQDIVFAWRVQLTGRALVLVHESVYYYRYRETLTALFHQARRWGASNVLLYKEFRSAGMPGRSLRKAGREWWRSLCGVALARSARERAPMLVRLGYCVGRLIGSIRHRCLYP